MCFFLKKEQKCIDYRTALQSNPLSVDSHAKLGAVRFALLGLLQLNLHDSVQLGLFMLLCECAVELAILTPCSEAPC